METNNNITNNVKGFSPQVPVMQKTYRTLNTILENAAIATMDAFPDFADNANRLNQLNMFYTQERVLEVCWHLQFGYDCLRKQNQNQIYSL